MVSMKRILEWETREMYYKGPDYNEERRDKPVWSGDTGNGIVRSR